VSCGPGQARWPSMHGRQTTRDDGVLIVRKLIAWVFLYSLDGLLQVDWSARDPTFSERVPENAYSSGSYGPSGQEIFPVAWVAADTDRSSMLRADSAVRPVQTAGPGAC
jgi:hypothetical protein